MRASTLVPVGTAVISYDLDKPMAGSVVGRGTGPWQLKVKWSDGSTTEEDYEDLIYP